MKILKVKKKKKEDVKMSEIKLGEFFDTAGKTFELSDIESEDNYPLYVAPFLGENKQIHINNSQSVKVFSEDGTRDESYEDDTASRAVIEGVIFSDSEEGDTETDTTILYDVGAIGDESLHEFGFEDRLQLLHKLAESSPLFADTMIVDWQKVNNFSELTDYIKMLNEDATPTEGIRVKRPDSAFGEEVIIPLGEEVDGEVALEEEALPEEIDEPFTPTQEDEEQLKLV